MTMAGWQQYDEQNSFLANFSWTSEFSPKNVAATYKRELPVIVKVTSGYDGCDGMHEFAMEEVYCIVAIKKQKRVVVTDINDRYISIPFDYHVKFHTVDGNNKPIGEARPLSEICPKDTTSSNFSLRMMFEQNQAVKFNDGADLGSKVKLGIIEFDEIYNERYLVCHPLQTSEILSDVVLIPIYVPISISVAEGFVSSSADSFSDWMRCIAASVQAFDSTSIQPCTEIVVFEESPASDYTYINPLNLFKHTMKGGSSSDAPQRDSDDFKRYLNITQCKEKQRGRVSVFGAQLPPMIDQGRGPGKSQGQGQSKSQGQGLGQGHGLGKGQSQGRSEPSKTMTSPGPPLPPRNFTKAPSPEKEVLSSIPPAPPAPPAPRKGSASTSGQTKSPTTSSAPAKVKRDELKVMRPSSPAKSSSSTPGSTDPSKRPRLPIPIKEQISSFATQKGSAASRTVKNVDDPVKATSVAVKDPSPPVNSKRALPSKPVQDYRSADAIQNMNKVGFFSSGKPLKDCPSLIEDCCQLPKNILPQCKDSIDDVEYETLPESPEDLFPLSGRKEDSTTKPLLSPTWKSVQDIPVNLDIRLLTVDELCRCLELLKMDRLVVEFQRRMVDGSLLMDLTSETLKQDFGMTLFDATKLMKFARDGWRPKTQ